MMIRKIKDGFNSVTIKAFMMLSALMTLPSRLFADLANPWAGGAAVTPDDLQTTVDTKASTGLRAILIVSGVVIFISGILVLINVLNKSAEDKKTDGTWHGVIVVLVAIFCILVGIVLVGMGFTGATALANG